MNQVLDCDDLQYFLTFSHRPASRSPSWETCDIPTDTVTLHSVYLCFRSNNSDSGIKVETFTDIGMIKSTMESQLRLNYWSWKIIYRFKLRIVKFYKSTGHMLHLEQSVCNSFPLIRRYYSAQSFCQCCLKVMICQKHRQQKYSWHFLSLVLFPGVEK